LVSATAEAGTPVRMADINVSLNPTGVSSNPQSLLAMDGYTIFRATDAAHGTELRRTDGTTAGTVLLRDINPGLLSAVPAEFVRVGNKAYFIADNGETRDLWVTDGTTPGTKRVKAITVGESPAALETRFLTNVKGTLYFVASTADTGSELWKSDGTAAGTVLVKDILPGPVSSNIRSLIASNDDLIFSATDTGLGNELWKSDGTVGGTVQLAEIDPSDLGGDPSNMRLFNSKVYFTANNGNGTQVWSTNGTPGGTVKVTAIAQPLNTDLNPRSLTVFNNNLYFVSESQIATYQTLFRLSTTNVLTAVSGVGSGELVNRFSNLLATPTRLYYAAYTAVNGEELFRLKASGLQSEVAAELLPGFSGGVPRNLVNVGETVYFTSTDLVLGVELFKFEGGNWSLVKDVNAQGGASSFPREVIVNGSALVFAANNGLNGIELWTSNGTEAGTRLVKDVAWSNGDSSPTALTAFKNSTMLFSADDGLGSLLFGREPWLSNGEASGTARLKDVNPDESSGMTQSDFFAIGATRAFFNGTTLLNGKELWTTDGTGSGTVLTRDIRPGTSAGVTAAGRYAMVGDVAFFPATDSVAGTEMWKSDGTNLGTVRIRDLNTGAASGVSVGSEQYPVALGSSVYFTGNTAANGAELYRTDGTSAGTVRLTDIIVGAGSSQPANITVFGGNVFFTAQTVATGREWYRFNVANSTTQILKDVGPGGTDGAPLGFGRGVVSGGTMFFLADDGVNGQELWASTGNPADPLSTRLVKDINPGLAGARIVQLTPGPNGSVFFLADDGVSGRELWVSDGTDRATVRVVDLFAGEESGGINERMVMLNDALYFVGSDGEAGVELWSIGATSLTGLRRESDVNRGLASSNVSQLTVQSGKVYFSATDGLTGQELYTLAATCSPADIADDAGIAPPVGVNNGLTEGDYNAFFSAFFDNLPAANIADDAGNAPPVGTNNGVTEGDYNAFFRLFFDGCPI